MLFVFYYTRNKNVCRDLLLNVFKLVLKSEISYTFLFREQTPYTNCYYTVKYKRICL